MAPRGEIWPHIATSFAMRFRDEFVGNLTRWVMVVVHLYCLLVLLACSLALYRIQSVVVASLLFLEPEDEHWTHHRKIHVLQANKRVLKYTSIEHIIEKIHVYNQINKYSTFRDSNALILLSIRVNDIHSSAHAPWCYPKKTAGIKTKSHAVSFALLSSNATYRNEWFSLEQQDSSSSFLVCPPRDHIFHHIPIHPVQVPLSTWII